MPSFFAERVDDNRAKLSDEDRRHALTVMRLVPGDSLTAVLDGGRFLCTLREAGELDVVAQQPDNEPKLHITLYQGITKADKLDGIVQMATQLGAVRVVPVAFKRSVSLWTGAAADKKVQRLQKIAREATLQCGRALVPTVESPLTVSELAERLSAHQLALVPWEEAGQGSLAQAYGGQTDIALVIGPEGGIDPAEIALLSATPVTLGPRILRTETAGPAAIAALLTLSGDMA